MNTINSYQKDFKMEMSPYYLSKLSNHSSGTIDYRRPIKCLRWDKLSPVNSSSSSSSDLDAGNLRRMPTSYSPIPSMIDCPPTSHCVTFRDPSNPDLVRYGCAFHFFGFLDESRYGSEGAFQGGDGVRSGIIKSWDQTGAPLSHI